VLCINSMNILCPNKLFCVFRHEICTWKDMNVLNALFPRTRHIKIGSIIKSKKVGSFRKDRK
jgi:hypothetical protein